MQVRSLTVSLVLLIFAVCILPLARPEAAIVQTSAAPPSENVIRAWYPLQPGDTWIYQKESDDGGNTGGMAHPMIERWKTEETITSVTKIPEAVFVTKRTKVFDHVTLNGWLAANDRTREELPESHMLIRHNCIYVLDGLDAEDFRNALDATKHLRSDYRDDLIRDRIAPDFCVPMDQGSTWGTVLDTSPAEEWVWHVTGVNADPFGDNRGRTLHLTAHAWAGTVIDRWFEPGVGVLQEVMEHHGHYDEDRRQLLRTIIGGNSRNYDLKPARAAALSASDCGGAGWKRFVREDGTSFENEHACVIYEDGRTHAAK